MNKKLFIFFIGIAITLYACGPNAQQQAALQKIHDDSVKNAAIAETKRQVMLAQHKADSARQAQIMLARLKQELIDTRAKLDAANDEMNHIKEFQIGRTAAQRDTQIENQSKYIQELTEATNELQKKINSMQ